MDYIEIGQREGARLNRRPICRVSFGNGYYVSPTVFSETRLDMRTVQEEIFGPGGGASAFLHRRRSLEVSQ
ncbi:MAG: aldehyde dehydrogenase family protein [Cyanobacteriota/Melainabacteria group bacterium]